MAVPLEYMIPKLPGLGDVDWGKYVSALTDTVIMAALASKWKIRRLKAVLKMLRKQLF